MESWFDEVAMSDQPHVLVVDDDSHIAASLRRTLIYEATPSMSPQFGNTVHG